MKIEPLILSSKDRNKKLKCRLLQFLFGALRVNAFFFFLLSAYNLISLKWLWGCGRRNEKNGSMKISLFSCVFL